MNVLTTTLCIISVAVGMDAELRWSVKSDDEDRIVSQWKKISADEQHQLRDRFDEILRPLGYETSLVVIRRANSIALYFICMTLAALMSLRDQWCRRHLRDLVESLFTFLSDDTGKSRKVPLWRLTWSLIDYERCLGFFSSAQG